MPETLNKLTRLQHLVDLGTRTKSELNALDAKIQEIANAGGQPNVIEEIWLNGVKQTVEEGKAVKLTVEQYDDTAIAGRISAIEGDYLRSDLRNPFSYQDLLALQQALSLKASGNDTDVTVLLKEVKELLKLNDKTAIF